jgi:hypothetical protein
LSGLLAAGEDKAEILRSRSSSRSTQIGPHRASDLPGSAAGPWSWTTGEVMAGATLACHEFLAYSSSFVVSDHFDRREKFRNIPIARGGEK